MFLERKRTFITCVIILACILMSCTVFAQPDEDSYPGTDFVADLATMYEYITDEETEYEVNEQISEGLSKAIALEFIKEDEIENYSHPISKQNAASLIYNVVKKYAPEFEISAEEERALLNLCYDNGKLYPENRAAYAFCLKHGIFKYDKETNPGEPITKEQSDVIISRTFNCFNKDISFMIDGKTININDHVSTLLKEFGNPNRIDKTVYGFSWYVYNSSYSNFFMAGIKEDRVCAFYSNAENLEFDGMTPGDRIASPNIKNLRVFPDEKGKFNAVSFNPFKPEKEYDKETFRAAENELGDIINAHRTCDGKLTLNKIDSINKVNVLSQSEGQSVGELFYKIIVQKKENPDIINETINTSADMKIDISTNDDGELVAEVTTNSGVFGILPQLPETVEPEKRDFSVKKPVFVEKPKIISIKDKIILDKDKDVKIELQKSVSDKYYLKIFDVELHKDVVCQYITSNEKEFIIDKNQFTAGADYIIEMCSLDGEKMLYGDKIEFTYGDAANPVYIEHPFDNSYTYDSEIEVYVSSSVYHDFRFEVINSRNETIVSVRTTDTKAAILESIPSGKYTLKATALKRNTDATRGSYSVNFEVKKVEPEVMSYVLEPDEKFNFVYESPDSKYLYFYDEDIIYIDEVVKETVKEVIKETIVDTVSEPLVDEHGEPVFDENGAPVLIDREIEEEIEREVEKEVEKTVKSPRKKIIRKKVPATKQYQKLRCMYTSSKYTTGAITDTKANETGNNIANTALLYQGVPYVWGGTSPSGFDCSGLVKYVCNKLGINVHRTSAEQFAYDGQYVLKSQLIPGDLLFFQDNGVIHHVGIYIGNGEMVHAPHTGEAVRVASINSDYYIKEYAGAKRISK